MGFSFFDPLGLVVLVAVVAMAVWSARWYAAGRQHYTRLDGGLSVLRRVATELPAEHPIRRRLEAAPVSELSFEEIARLMTGDEAQPSARGLVRLEAQIDWMERFAQFAVHLGILGTVFALAISDPTDLEGFRARLPSALSTTFWGLVGAMVLSWLSGASEGLLAKARQHVRDALLAGFERD